MAFILYDTNGEYLVNTEEKYSLAGYNLIYQTWESRGNPTNQGWHISRNDLAATFNDSKKSEKNYRFLIDFDPNSVWRIGIIELLDIYVYTFAGESGKKALWSPIMLRLQHVLYEEFDDGITKQEKEKRITRIPESESSDDFIEFLYLHGTNKGWNWGMSGMTNAAFLEDEARDYFRQFF